MTKIAIIIRDEMDNDKILEAEGKLDLDTGWITDVKYEKLPIGVTQPSKESDYMFTCGIMPLNGAELEFAIDVESSGQYKVSREQLAEIKEKAANLLTKKNKM